mgnify:CR=1 FL=1
MAMNVPLVTEGDIASIAMEVERLNAHPVAAGVLNNAIHVMGLEIALFVVVPGKLFARDALELATIKHLKSILFVIILVNYTILVQLQNIPTV